MTVDRVTYEAGGWHYTCARRDLSASMMPDLPFVALAKRDPFVNFDPIREPGEVWFEFGRTAAEALFKVTAEVTALANGTA